MDKFAHTSDGIFEIQRGITASFMIQAPGLIEGIKLIVPGRNILESSNLFFALRGFLDFFASDVICDHLAWLEENCLVLNAPDYHSQAALFIINVLVTLVQVAMFIIFQTPEEGIGFPMSLAGFGEGYDKLP